MRRVFADAHYWVAILNDQDQSHTAAQAAGQALPGVPIITTEEALTEMLAFFSERGQYLRQSATAFIDGILSNPGIQVRPQSHQSFLDASSGDTILNSPRWRGFPVSAHACGWMFRTKAVLNARQAHNDSGSLTPSLTG